MPSFPILPYWLRFFLDILQIFVLWCFLRFWMKRAVRFPVRLNVRFPTKSGVRFLYEILEIDIRDINIIYGQMQKSDRIFSALIWELYSHLSVDNVDNSGQTPSCKAYRSINPYTALYQHYLFRHRIGTKNLYRCSGTFRQKSPLIFGYFVYWLFLLTCSAFSTKKKAPAIKPGLLLIILQNW